MRAMVLERPGTPLRLREVPLPRPGPRQVLLRVLACAVCRTDLHVADGELPNPKLPVIPGHEIVGVIERRGERVERIAEGDRVGVPWLGYVCGECRFCQRGQENLCDRALFTGYQLDGGFAEYAVADERFCFPLPSRYGDLEVAPFLCAGLIGYRALRLSGSPEKVGLYGFGAAAHLLTQVARHEGRRVFAFTRPGDNEAQGFARRLGAGWAGGADELPPEPLDAALIFAPVGGLVPKALSAVGKGGVVVCAGIHMSDIPSFPYSLLWGERVVRSVANLTREDAERFLAVAPEVPVRTRVQPYALEETNEALDALRSGQMLGAAVVVPYPAPSGRGTG